MDENEEFFITTEERIIADIEEFTSLPSYYFDLKLLHRDRRKMRTHSWKDLSMAEWSYIVVHPRTGKTLVSLGGWMHIIGGNWSDLHSHAMMSIVAYDKQRKEALARTILGRHPMLDNEFFVDSGTRSIDRRRRSLIATLPVVGGVV